MDLVQVGLLQPLAQGVIKPGLERLMERYRTKASELAQDLLSLREAYHAAQDTIHEKQEENRQLELQVCQDWLCHCIRLPSPHSTACSCKAVFAFLIWVV